MDDNPSDLDTGVEELRAEGETAAGSPASEETAQAEPEEEASASTESTEETPDKTIPYSRFKEVNEKARQAEERLKELEERMNQSSTPQKEYDPQAEQVKQTLKQYGFVSEEDVKKELQKLREDSALEQRLTRLEGSYSGKDGRPKFDRNDVVQFAIDNQIADPEAAYKIMHEKELIDWHISQAAGKTSGVKTEKSDGSGTPTVGPSNDDLKKAAMKGDDEAFNTLLGRTNVFQKMFGK